MNPATPAPRSVALMAGGILAGCALFAGIAIGVTFTAQPAATPTPAPTVTVAPSEGTDAALSAQIMETCAWEQATFYAPVKDRAAAYAEGLANCERSAQMYGMEQIITKYGTGE